MMKNNTSRKPNKIMIVVACIALAAALGTIAVFAYLSGKTDSVKNTLTADKDPVPQVTEGPFDGVIKQNVAVNVGTNPYTVYVRAAIVVTWSDGNGNIYADKPVEGTDYTIDYNVASTATTGKWTKGSNDFYYYADPVASGGTTANLINSASVKEGANEPAGYSLKIEIVAQTIQAIGWTDADDTRAVTDAWGATVNDAGLLVAP